MFLELLRKEFRLIINTPMLLWMNTLYPIIVVGILPFATTMEVKSLKTIVIDQDRSELSEHLRDCFLQSSYFVPYGEELAEGEAVEATTLIEEGLADVVITITQGFEKQLMRGQEAAMLVVVNSINASKGAAGQAYAQLVVKGFEAELAEQASPQSHPTQLDFRQKVLFNPEANYQLFVVPGILALLVTLVSIIMPAIGMVQEKEYGTIEQLNVTPLNPTQLLLSKAIPYWIILLVLMPLLLLITRVLFNLHTQGSFLGVMLLTLLNAIAFTGVGFFLASFASRMQQLMFMSIFVLINVLLLGGIFTPVGGMPEWAQFVAKLLPNYYYTRDLRSIILRGSGIADIGEGLLVLLGFAVFFSLLARFSYRKRT